MREAVKSSPVRKRSVTVNGLKTAITLEDQFWSGLQEVAAEKGCSVMTLVSIIKKTRQPTNLSSAIRVYVLDFYRTKAAS